jgi:hypothetical protein
MPFTFSHPAAILPFKIWGKQYFPLSALIIGSISPDFEYFLKMNIDGTWGHNIAGLFYFDLPMSLVLFWVFHRWVKKPLLEQMPTFIGCRFEKLYHFDGIQYLKQHYFKVIFACLIGALTHLFWDSFTHPHQYFVQNIPLLQSVIIHSPFEIQWYKILQHGSTLLGGLLLLFVIWKLPISNNTTIQKPFNLYYWKPVVLFPLILCVIRILTAGIGISLIIVGISGILWGLIYSSWRNSKVIDV